MLVAKACLVDKSWTCDSGAPPFANASSSVVRVFFCCGGVIGVRSAAAQTVLSLSLSV